MAPASESLRNQVITSSHKPFPYIHKHSFLRWAVSVQPSGGRPFVWAWSAAGLLAERYPTPANAAFGAPQPPPPAFVPRGTTWVYSEEKSEHRVCLLGRPVCTDLVIY